MGGMNSVHCAGAKPSGTGMQPGVQQVSGLVVVPLATGLGGAQQELVTCSHMPCCVW